MVTSANRPRGLAPGDDGLVARSPCPSPTRKTEIAGQTPIDANGQLVDGTKLTNPSDLRNAMLSRKEMFVSTATQKLLTYATGRTMQYYDMPTVRTIVRRAAANDYKFSSLVLGIVQSDAFQKKTKVKS